MNYDELTKEFNVSRETYNKLSKYHDLVIKWQKSINLISNNDIANIWERHIIDSLKLLPFLPKDKNIVDIGSGGGFPSIILAISGYKVTLIESDKKKTIFLSEVIRELKLDANIINKRAEKLDKTDVCADIITARACASLEKLFSISNNFLSINSICFFHKGKNYAKELEEAFSKWVFAHEIHQINGEGVIVEISGIKSK